MINQEEERAQRFWAKVQKTDGCWQWMGTGTQQGYGLFNAGSRRTIAAHRFAYLLVKGPIADGMVLDHLCRNPGCVNPAHLEAVTPQINTLRGIVAETVGQRQRSKTH